MKYLKKWKLFESINKDEIHDICKKYDITNYTINSDGTIDVDGDVDLSIKGLTKLPLRFNDVSGSFYCRYNKLTSLEGAPKSVGDFFSCENNKLTSLEGAPGSVGGGFDCSNNQLTSLEGAPQSVGGGFYCRYNKLTSLEGAPQSVGGEFYCKNNKIMSLKDAPQSIGGDFWCHDNKLTSLEGLEFKSFKRINLQNNPIYSIVESWINKDNKEDLIEYFVDMDIIQEGEDKPKLIMMRLEAFYEDMGLEMNIDFNKVKKYYKIV
jgi:hypothetical protein